MKTLLFLTSLSLFTVLFSSANKSYTTLTGEQLGEKVFDACTSLDTAQLMGLMVSAEDLRTTVEASSMPDSIKPKFIEFMVSKIKMDSVKMLRKNLKGMNKIKAGMDSCAVLGDLMTDSVVVKLDKLKNIPLTLGRVYVHYTCNEQAVGFKFKAIKTLDGWKLVEKLRVNVQP